GGRAQAARGRVRVLDVVVAVRLRFRAGILAVQAAAVVLQGALLADDPRGARGTAPYPRLRDEDAERGGADVEHAVIAAVVHAVRPVDAAAREAVNVGLRVHGEDFQHAVNFVRVGG